MKQHFKIVSVAASLAVVVAQTFSQGRAAGITRLGAEDKQYLLAKDKFRAVLRVKQLPRSVRGWFAQRATGRTSYLADPGQKYQAGCIVEKGSAPRRLLFAGVADDHCFVHYEKGGRGHSYHVVLFRLSGNEARLTWHGVAKRKMASLDQLRQSIAANDLSDELNYGY